MWVKVINSRDNVKELCVFVRKDCFEFFLDRWVVIVFLNYFLEFVFFILFVYICGENMFYILNVFVFVNICRRK